jgi:hypothetical protein
MVPWLQSKKLHLLGVTISGFGVLIFLLLAGSFLFLTLYIAPTVKYQWNCSDTQHCSLTMKNDGGGFHYGFSPSVTWLTTKNDTSLQFTPNSGTLQAGQSVQVTIIIASGSCPEVITIDGNRGTFNFSPFTYNSRTKVCFLTTASGKLP